jgi:hypothetical protein
MSCGGCLKGIAWKFEQLSTGKFVFGTTDVICHNCRRKTSVCTECMKLRCACQHNAVRFVERQVQGLQNGVVGEILKYVEGVELDWNLFNFPKKK